MATDTVPAAVPGPPDPPGRAATGEQPGRGFLASMVAAVEPARPTTFDLNPTTGGAPAADPDGVLDRSAPGVSSASFRGTAEEAAKGNDPAGARHKKSVWKEMLLAAATRWAKGGGTANKRLDLRKAKAQAHQVKESRTTTVTKSGGLPVRNSGGSGAGTNKGTGKSGGGSAGKGPTNGKTPSNSTSNGTGSNGAGRAGSGGSSGGRGSGGGQGSNGTSSGGRKPNGTGTSGSGSGKSPAGPKASSGGTGKGTDSSAGQKTSKGDPSTRAGKGSGASSGGGTGSGASGGAGKPGSAGKSGKDGASGKAGTGTDAKGTGGKPDPTKDPKPSSTTDVGKGVAKDGSGGSTGPAAGKPGGQNTGSGKGGGQQPAGAEKTPLQKSRETGHGDGSAARRVADHVKAYVDGTRDGWADEKTKNAREHDRLDKAHTDQKTKTGSTPAVVIVTDEGDDGVSTDVKPLLVKEIDANTLTLGSDSARGSVSRRELRNFKQYERKLETKETVLQKIAEACKALEKQAEEEAKDCQKLAEQAKGVEGGAKLITTLNKLAESAKNQAAEAGELAKTAQRAAEMCKVVLTNIQTRYAPLYKAVVDSDETKPAEGRFYTDKGSYTPAA
ncbi:hypothetical protein [Streptomyces europaeiscabiei]|uniref:hypothetical protein n=1 Tax=Streptomyces europaeiscabiei TaxID=146819 RepID=UPI002E2751EA|nr:hypothetical protein OG858_47940 [Streptomyces europaeiscabiei]